MNDTDKNLKIAIFLTTLIFLLEFAGGIVSNSLALLSDSFHVFMDVVALLLTYGAIRISSRPSNSNVTFGYHRFEIFAALINGLTIIGIGIFIFYEAYEEMVEEILKKIEKEVSGNWNIKKFFAIHRIGYLKVGEISVIVGVSSEHRKEAFEACSYGIDNIKKRCPIWKKEEMESGNSEWVEGVMINE